MKGNEWQRKRARSRDRLGVYDNAGQEKENGPRGTNHGMDGDWEK